jgi:benzoylformate decarboxylase
MVAGILTRGSNPLPMNIHEATFKWMRARGIRYLFGNPGSTELPFLVNLPDGVR